MGGALWSYLRCRHVWRSWNSRFSLCQPVLLRRKPSTVRNISTIVGQRTKKRREKYIPVDELVDFRAQIERRKELEQELKALKKQLPKAKTKNYGYLCVYHQCPHRRGVALLCIPCSSLSQARVLPPTARLHLWRAACLLYTSPSPRD